MCRMDALNLRLLLFLCMSPIFAVSTELYALDGDCISPTTIQSEDLILGLPGQLSSIVTSDGGGVVNATDIDHLFGAWQSSVYLPDDQGSFAMATEIFGAEIGSNADDLWTGQIADHACLWFNFTGTSNNIPGVRIRFNKHPDILLYENLKLSIQVHAMGADALTISLKDNEWQTAIADSNLVTLAKDDLLIGSDQPQTISMPLSSLFNDVFNPAELTDLVISVSGGNYSADFTVNGIWVSGMAESDDIPVLNKNTKPVQTTIRQITSSVLEVTLDGSINTQLSTDASSWGIKDVNSGHAIPVTQVGRFTSTLNADDSKNILYRHRLYLKLASPLIPGLDYSLSTHSELTVPELPEKNFSPTGVIDAIKINQHGYNAASTKRYAYVGYWLGSAGSLEIGKLPYKICRAKPGPLVDNDPCDEVTSGFLQPRSVSQWKTNLDPYPESSNDYVFSGEEVYEIDLSNLTQGTYFIDVKNLGRSRAFRVGGGAFEAFYTTFRGLYHQRCTTALLPEFTPWARNICHGQTLFDAYDPLDPAVENWGDFFPATTPQMSKVTGGIAAGWHDAGDFDRRPLHLQVVQHVLILAEMFPSHFQDNTLNLPESGNGLPDILDEALYGLRLWELLQQPNGAVRSGIESFKHPGDTTSVQDNMPYWIYGVNRYTTYAFAAVAAHAARILKNHAGTLEKSQELEARALMAWDWAEAQTTYGTTSPVDKPLAAHAKEIASVRLWATGELFTTTGDTYFQTLFKKIWDCNAPDIPKDPLTNQSFGDCSGVKSDQIIEWWGMAVAGGTNVDVSLQLQVRGRIKELADQMVMHQQFNRYRHSRAPHYQVSWGNATHPIENLRAAMMSHYFADDANTKQKYVDAVSLDADFQLGAHPWGRSWITGLGYETPANVLHLDSIYDTHEKPVPGIPIDGAMAGSCDSGNTYWTCLTYNGFYPTTYNPMKPYIPNPPLLADQYLPPARYYSEWTGMAPMNEFSVWNSMIYTAFGQAWLYAVSGEVANTAAMGKLTEADYPLNALTWVDNPDEPATADNESLAPDPVDHKITEVDSPHPTEDSPANSHDSVESSQEPDHDGQDDNIDDGVDADDHTEGDAGSSPNTKATPSGGCSISSEVRP